VEQLAHRDDRILQRHRAIAVHRAVAERVDHPRLAEHRLSCHVPERRLVVQRGEIVLIREPQRRVVFVRPRDRQLERATPIEARRAWVRVRGAFRTYGRVEDSRPFATQEGEVAHASVSREDKQRGFGIGTECNDIRYATAENRLQVGSAAVTYADPDNLRRRTVKKTQLPEVVVFRDDRESLYRGVPPNGLIIATCMPDIPNVCGAGVQFDNPAYQPRRDVLIEQELQGTPAGRRLGRRTGEPALPVRSKRQCSPYVRALEIREIGEYLGLGHTTREVIENVIDRDPQATNTRFAAPFARLDRDPVAIIHRSRVDQCRGQPQAVDQAPER
jgi:hypothetical protein